jgi:hypothetical protein
MWLLLIAHSLAATPARLPPGESPAAWAQAFALAELTPGVPGTGAWVDFVAGSSGWTVRVRDRSGQIREASVPAPKSSREREEIALIVVTLLQPITFTVPKAVPTPPPVAPRPKPVLTPVPVPEPAPPEPAPPEPVPAPPPPEPAPVLPPPPPPPAPPYVLGQVSIGAELRPWSVGTAYVTGDVSLVVDAPLRPVVGLSATLPSRIVTVQSEVTWWGAEVWGGARYSATAPFRFDFGLAAGAVGRTFTQEGKVRGTKWVPMFLSTFEVPVTVARGVALVPAAHLQTDLSEIDVLSVSEGPVRFGDWALRVSLGARFGGPKVPVVVPAEAKPVLAEPKPVPAEPKPVPVEPKPAPVEPTGSTIPPRSDSPW